MKLKSLKIEALFNTFSYDLQFNSQDKYLILTGINGYGKTTILNMISALAIKDLYYFYTVPFASIDFEFEDGSVLSLSSDRVDDITSADVPVRGGRRLLFLILILLYARSAPTAFRNCLAIYMQPT